MIPNILKDIVVNDFVSVRADSGRDACAIVLNITDKAIELLTNNDNNVIRETIYYDSTVYVFRILGYIVPFN